MQHDVAGDPITGIRWARRTTEKIATELVLRARRQFVPLRDTRRADLRTLRSALRDQSRSSTYRPSSARSILRRIAASSLCFTRCVCHPRTAPRPRRQLKPLPTTAPEARRLLLPDAKARPYTIADPFTVNLNLDTDLPAIPRIPVDLLGVAIRLVEHPLIASSCRHRPAPAIRTRIEKHDSVVLSKMSLRKLELHVVYTRIVAGALPGAKIAHLYRSKRRYLNASKLGPIRVAPAVPRRPQVVRNRTPRRNRETRVGPPPQPTAVYITAGYLPTFTGDTDFEIGANPAEIRLTARRPGPSRTPVRYRRRGSRGSGARWRTRCWTRWASACGAARPLPRG